MAGALNPRPAGCGLVSTLAHSGILAAEAEAGSAAATRLQEVESEIKKNMRKVNEYKGRESWVYMQTP